MAVLVLECRKRVLVNTDPQRRCYNGGHFSSELRLFAWEVLEHDVPKDKVESRLAFWRDLNDYAVSRLGKWASKTYRVVELQE